MTVPGRAAAASTATAADDWHVDEDAGGGDGWPKERRIALAAFGVLVLTPLLIWLIAVVLQGRGDDLSVAPGESTSQEGDADPDATDEGAADGDADGTGEAGGVGETGGESGGDQAGTEPRTVDFDGRCTVDVEAAAIDDDTTLRPWHFDECTYAPVDLDAGQDRWIVVIASIDGEAPEEEARSRLASYGSGYGMLWSTHYPSLNPGWWVVYDGPFSAEDDATAAADAAGGGAYPRVLSDDEGDRYCIAEDGC